MTLAVLALGLVGLAIDRIFLLPGSAAGEQVVRAEQAAPEVVAEEVTRDDSNSIDVGEILSDRLDALWADREFDPCSVRDAFSLQVPWHGDQTPGGSTEPDAVAKFVHAHTLNATVVNGELSRALVDGRSLTLGGELDGFRLVGIDETSASFEADGRTVALTLRGADNPSSKN